MSKAVEDLIRSQLKVLLPQCSIAQQNRFIRIYGNDGKPLDVEGVEIEAVIDKMPGHDLDNALRLVDATIKGNN